MVNRCVPVVWRASHVEEDAWGGMEGKVMRGGDEETRKRTDDSRALSTGSLGHSYASAAGTISPRKSRICYIRPRPRLDVSLTLHHAKCESIAIVRRYEPNLLRNPAERHS